MGSVVVNNTTRTVTISGTGKRGLPGPEGDVTPEAIAARDAAQAAALAAHEDAEQTALDRAATHDDAVATDQDRQATAADRAATGQDREATAGDREATADDRRQTGQDLDAIRSIAETVVEDRDAAHESADLAAAWANGHEPGGPGTMSAREYSEAAADSESRAAASAATAAAANLISYGVLIYNAAAISAGGYYAERRASVASKQTTLYAEIIDGESGSAAAIAVLVGGELVYGPVTVSQGAPITLPDLNIPISASSDVLFSIAPSAGAIRELFVRIYGVAA